MVGNYYLLSFEAVNRISKTHRSKRNHKCPHAHCGEDNALEDVVSFLSLGELCYHISPEIHDTIPSNDTHDPSLDPQHSERSALPNLGND